MSRFSRNQTDWKKVLPYVYVIAGFFLAMYLIILLADKLIIPSYVHDRETVPLPDVQKMKLDDAIANLELLDLRYIVNAEQYDSELGEGYVIKQMPKPNSEVKVGRTIFLTVSKGTETVEVPYLIGRSVRKAREILMQKGLILGDAKYVYNDEVLRDTILSQSIPYRHKAPYESIINVEVSKGPELEFAMPYLLDLSFREAIKVILEHGLIVGDTAFVKNETYSPGTIISQSPQAMEMITKNTVVNLVVVSP